MDAGHNDLYTQNQGVSFAEELDLSRNNRSIDIFELGQHSLLNDASHLHFSREFRGIFDASAAKFLRLVGIILHRRQTARFQTTVLSRADPQSAGIAE